MHVDYSTLMRVLQRLLVSWTRGRSQASSLSRHHKSWVSELKAKKLLKNIVYRSYAGERISTRILYCMGNLLTEEGDSNPRGLSSTWMAR